jgi:hypothetical protein
MPNYEGCTIIQQQILHENHIKQLGQFQDNKIPDEEKI